MAISSYEKGGDKIVPTETQSSCSKSSTQSSRRIVKIDNSADGSISSSTCEHSKKKKNTSPYLTEGRVEMLSRITEKRLVRKKTTDFTSSFPMALNIYKASSDEFKALKKSKKVKKSVLTLPNEPAPVPQACTVSDMNDSEYLDEKKRERHTKQKKRTMTTNRRPRMNKAMELFDRDTEYCSRFNIDLDRSSTDMMNQLTGDGKKICMKRRNNKSKESNIKAHDVWSMLKNMNRFPFKSSPPMSDDSIVSVKKRNTYNKRRNSRMDGTKFIETCTTEEFTFFSNSIDKSAHNSQSSIDCITVIDKKDEYQELCKELKVLKNKNPLKILNQNNINKIKPCVRSEQTNDKAIIAGMNTDKFIHQNDVNLNLRNELHKSPQNKAKVPGSILMRPYDVSRRTKLGLCSFNCHSSIIKKDLKEYNVSEEKDHFNSNLCNGDVKDLTIDQNIPRKISSCDSQGPINGITKVVLSKGPNIVLTKKFDAPKRKPRSVTTMPSAALYPKLTQAEIKRRISNMKFPIVILAKDQLTSAPFQVINYEQPQFVGLDKHIWPFMRNWQKKGNTICENSNNQYCPVHEKTTKGMKGDYVRRNNNVIQNNNEKISFAAKDNYVVQPVPVFYAEKLSDNTPKTKPIRQFKERMLQFLQKKSSFDGDRRVKMSFPQELTKRREVYHDRVDVGTNNQRNIFLTNVQNEINDKKGNMLKYNMLSNMKQPWAKGRWASDFIDNVIKKLKNGVYYNQEEKYSSRNHSYVTKEDSVQTEIYFAKHDLHKKSFEKSNPIIEEINDSESVSLLPGFDDNFSDLQIESINKNQIAVKHCITNIIVQFDVGTPSEINPAGHLKRTMSFIPVSITESPTKIFKSKVTIVNAMLPAELCSILPKIMKSIIDSKEVLPRIADKVESHLSTIDELAQRENGDSIKQLIPIHFEISTVMRSILQGKFSNKKSRLSTNTSSKIKVNQDYLEKVNLPDKKYLLPNINIHLLFNWEKDLMRSDLHVYESQRSVKPQLENDLEQRKIKTCMQLQPYKASNTQVIGPADTKLNFFDMAARILNIQNFSIQFTVPMINQLSYLYNKDNGNIIRMQLNTTKNKASCITCDIKVDSLYDGFQERFNDIIQTPSFSQHSLNKQITNNRNKYTDLSQNNKFENCKNGVAYCVTNSRNKKRSFVKLYKKCKSMSNIPNERSCTALRKITNLDDFFFALGSAKTLASVFERTVERKILSSIREMKSWINDITPRQALLVLLLATKKDTSNLLRYRPVILQGIAVKRITRASELDMEIEVIERENLNILSQYEGISYFPASVENQDSLLEELYWIAKTTASDYQKPFDESSERLLKSLLEKRKKLNPSYLRVMARYVGLGLLKPPKK